MSTSHVGKKSVPGNPFDLSPPDLGLTKQGPVQPPHKAHHHYFGWHNTMENREEFDGSRDSFQKYGNALKYCNDVQVKSSLISTRRA